MIYAAIVFDVQEGGAQHSGGGDQYDGHVHDDDDVDVQLRFVCGILCGRVDPQWMMRMKC